MKPSRAIPALVLGLVCSFSLARAQEDDELDDGLEGASREPRLVLLRAIEAMGGADALRALKAVTLAIERPTQESATRERHTLPVEGRRLHCALYGKSATLRAHPVVWTLDPALEPNRFARPTVVAPPTLPNGE